VHVQSVSIIGCINGWAANASSAANLLRPKPAQCGNFESFVIPAALDSIWFAAEIGGENAQQRRGAADCGEYSQAPRATKKQVIRSTFRKSAGKLLTRVEVRILSREAD
jgi:hypothetical protein